MHHRNQQSVALLCQHFYPEMISTGMHMTELATRLAELGWTITVYCAQPSWGSHATSGEKIPQQMQYQQVEIQRVPTWGNQQASLFSRLLFAVTFLLSACWSLWRARKQYRGLILTTNPPFLGGIGWIFSYLFNLPYLLIIYDVYPDIAVNLGLLSPHSLIHRAWTGLNHIILNRAASVVVIGRDMEQLIKQRMSPANHERIVLIPNWSDERRIRPIAHAENHFRRETVGREQFLIQYGGRMGRTHNIEVLIEAAKLLKAEHGDDLLFQLIGDGAKRTKLEAMVAKYDLPNVHFLPYQSMDDLAAMLSAADLAIVCLEPEFTGLSVPSKSYGVMACGIPILGLLDPQGEIAQTIAEADCGVILAQPTGENVAQAILDLMANPVRRSQMGANGRNAFLTRYTLGQAAQAYDQALTQMVTLQKSRPQTRFALHESGANGQLESKSH